MLTGEAKLSGIKYPLRKLRGKRSLQIEIGASTSLCIEMRTVSQPAACMLKNTKDVKL